MTIGWSASYGLSILSSNLTGTLYVKFHTGSPGSSGTDNPASNTTRYATTWGSPVTFGSLALISNAATVTLTSVPTTETYTHFSLWTASSGGTFIRNGTVAGGSVVSGTSPTFAAGALVIEEGLAT